MQKVKQYFHKETKYSIKTILSIQSNLEKEYFVDGLLSDNRTWTESLNFTAIAFPNGEKPEEDCHAGYILSWKPDKTSGSNMVAGLGCQSQEKQLNAICTTSLCKKIN